MSKITFNEYLELARDPKTEDDVLLSFRVLSVDRAGLILQLNQILKKLN